MKETGYHLKVEKRGLLWLLEEEAIRPGSSDQQAFDTIVKQWGAEPTGNSLYCCNEAEPNGNSLSCCDGVEHNCKSILL